MPASSRETQTRARYGAPLRLLAAAASAALLILIVLGGVVRVTGSGLGCPGWPLCYGQLLPPNEVTALIEFSHRFTAVIASTLVVTLAVIALRNYRHDRAVLIPALAAVAVLVVQVLLGAVTVFMALSPAVVAIHLGTGLALFGCVLVLTTHVLTGPHPTQAAPDGGPLVPLALGLAASVFVLVILGATVTASDASLACDSWPLCGAAANVDGAQLQMIHRVAALVCGSLVVCLGVAVWRARAHRPAAWWMMVNLSGVFAAQALLGGLNVLTRLAVLPRGLHIAFGSMVWGLSVVVTVLVARPEAAPDAGKPAPAVEMTRPLGLDHGQTG